jgi:hypothetical protein
MTPEECLLYKSLVGDKKDNIPGLLGFGDITFKKMSPSARKLAIDALKHKDYLAWCRLEGLPRKCQVNLEGFKQLCIYWKLNSAWEVPIEEINQSSTCGRLNIPAAEIYMERFMV